MIVRCPRCGSEHVQYATKTTGGGFSFLDSCCGYILLGPLGLLCGACGSGTNTQEFWICHDCGHKFSTERAKTKAEAEARLVSEYQENQAMLQAAGGKSHNELEDDLDKSTKERMAAEQTYKEYLDTCIANGDDEIKKSASILKHEYAMWWADLVLFIGGVLTIAGMIIALIPTLIAAIYVAIYYPKMKKAKTILTQRDPMFSTLVSKVKAAEAQEDQNRKFVEASKKAKKYERTHSPK